MSNAADSCVSVLESDVFWGEIAPTEHMVHFYENDAEFVPLLEKFVTEGLRAGEGLIVVAAHARIVALNQRLNQNGFDLESIRRENRYVTVDASACLGSFMRNGWPDASLFDECISALINRVGRNGRPVRAYGEMVAILWAQGHSGATVRLEFLWNELRKKLPFPLFCAYPKSGFTQESEESFREIRAAHTKMIELRA